MMLEILRKRFACVRFNCLFHWEFSDNSQHFDLENLELHLVLNHVVAAGDISVDLLEMCTVVGPGYC
jgi:hypothetical protein